MVSKYNNKFTLICLIEHQIGPERLILVKVIQF